MFPKPRMNPEVVLTPDPDSWRRSLRMDATTSNTRLHQSVALVP